MSACAAQRGAWWHDGEVRDVEQEMLALTMTIVGRTLFDADIESETPEIREALTVFLDVFWTAMLPLAWLLEGSPLPAARRYRRARAAIDAVIYRLIEEHRAGGVDRGDLLSMLLLARDEGGDGGAMSDTQLRDEVLTLLFAGHETTALALTWAWYLLAQHPDVERRLHGELHRVLSGRLPRADDLPTLPYARMVLAETLRLYPPAWNVARRALEPVVLGGYEVPARALVMLSPYVTQHDPRFFPDPFRFDPERWTPEAEAARPRFSYFPFGGGPRQCMGESFAWTEATLLLATIAQAWRLRLVPGHPVALKTTVTLRPKHGVRMVLEKR
jgi:cytochrome P450